MTRRQLDDKLLDYLRVLAAVVLILAIVLLPLSEVINLPFKDPTYHLNPVVYGMMIAALLVLLGVATAAQLPWLEKKKDDPPDKKGDKDDGS